MDIPQAMITALQLCVFFGLPVFAWWACGRSRLLNLLSPVLLVYLGGIVFGNLTRVGSEAEDFSHEIAGVSVVMAIALLMVSADFKRWLRLAPKTLLAFSLIVATVVVLASLLSLVFPPHSGNAWQVAGMSAAVFTGGTANMAAVAAALDVDPITFAVLNSADIAIGGAYLAFLFLAGGRVFGWLLPPFQATPQGLEPLEVPPQPTPLGVVTSLVLAGAILAVAVALSKLAPAGMSQPFIVLCVTTLGILLSLLPRLRRIPGAYETGDYLLLVFCAAIGSLATLDKLDRAEPALFVYLLAVALGSITIHAFLCRLCRIDRDTTIITSVAALYGPPFIGPVAGVLGNREIIVSGITAGLVGLAVANYLGLAVAYGIKALLF